MKLFTKHALLAQGWANDVLFEIDEHGQITKIDCDVKQPSEAAQTLAGPTLPGMPNLHSHAFQRAMAGFAERHASRQDSFWTWRKLMYGLAERITPTQIQHIASQLYVDMLKAGYTAVGEFHYLHHAPGGKFYESPTELSDRVIAAAQTAGIAITHLPVLYAHGGFGAQAPNAGQRRFVNDIDRFAVLLEALYTRYRDSKDIRIGVAPHSLRAVTLGLVQQAIAIVTQLDTSAPIHIHIAEQGKEVEDCVAWSKKRPVEWLFDNLHVDERWCLVHATHLADDEVQQLAQSQAVAGLCPTTEANLGDGFFAAARYFELGGGYGIGSDSHVCLSPGEELRMLEYGQRLLYERRAILAANETSSVGASLYINAAKGGARALGCNSGRLEVGARADLVVLDPEAPILLGKQGDLLLDAMVFASSDNPVKDVMVGGQWRVVDGHHQHEAEILRNYERTQHELWT
ncbi:MAG: formimidoylglutamate deiminase [Gammaproteobacteria bacterium]|nr:formimidoylglutamate deiminase [Gammaproteobacteria bacterium]